jgi:hypothetical protein
MIFLNVIFYLHLDYFQTYPNIKLIYQKNGSIYTTYISNINLIYLITNMS